MTPEAQWLYETAERWYDSWIWNTILTPNYDVNHDNHYHVDLKPNNHFIGYWDDRYFGPNPNPGE